MSDRRTLLKALAASGLTAGTPPPRPPADPASQPPGRDVRAFGAKGDGLTDDTAAFNAATGAGEDWRASLGHAIVVPPGTYRIDGTVFLRRGQDLSGAGDATIIDASRATGRTIVLGGGRAGSDPGGAPASLSRLRFLGGSGTAPLIQVAIEGFAIRDLFISAAGTAIEVNGADGLISGIVIDQALNGLVLRSARNVLIDRVIGYLANYAVTIDGGTCDVALTNLILAYSRNASILFAEAAENITSIRVANATFVSSIQYPGFVGHVHARAAPFDAQFTACVFRNWRDHAVVQGAGSGADLSFSDCTFDGARSHPSYNQSSTARGVRTGAEARVRLDNCRFRHLDGEVALIGPGLRELSITGGAVEDCPGDPVRVAAAPAGRVRVRGVDGFGRRVERPDASGLVLPWVGAFSGWRIVASRRRSPGGAASATIVVTEADGTMTCAIGEASRFGAGAELSVGFGDAPGGPMQIPRGAGSGRVCVWASTPGLVWSVDSVG